MRVVTFDKYDPEATPVAVQAKAWQIMWMAINNYPAGNREQTVLGNKVFNEIRDAAEIVYTPDKKTEVGRRLNPAGTEIYFQDDEFRILAQAIEKFRENVVLSGSDALLWVDRVLDKAPEMSKKDYVAKVKRIKLEPVEA